MEIILNFSLLRAGQFALLGAETAWILFENRKKLEARLSRKKYSARSVQENPQHPVHALFAGVLLVRI